MSKSIADKLRDRAPLDHSMLSPSGRVSNRARNAALERQFGGENKITTRELHLARLAAIQPTQAERLRREAERLRSFAAGGMRVRAFTKEAARLDAEADALESEQ